jgi:hypothetical protein
MELKVTVMHADDLPEYISEMDKTTREWTMRAARGECGWICSDCCSSDDKGMPDACFHGSQWCTDIIKRDKLLAMKEGNEPV